MKDNEYLSWKRDNSITNLRELDRWLNETISDGRYFMYIHEDKKSYDLIERYLDEMPVNRQSAEEIMDAIKELEFLYYKDELIDLLKTKFMNFLIAEEIKMIEDEV